MLADDQKLFIESVGKVLDTVRGLRVIGHAENGKELLELVAIKQPDIILLDLEMPVMNGWEALDILHVKYPKIKVIILTVHFDVNETGRYLKLGASAYISKSSGYNELIKAIHTVNSQKYLLNKTSAKKVVGSMLLQKEDAILELLTEQDVKVLSLHCEGKSNKEIADLLCLGIDAVKYHMKIIRSKTSLHASQELVKFAIRTAITSID